MTEEPRKNPAEENQEDFKYFFSQLLTLLPPKAREYVIQYSREILSCVIVVVLGVVLYSGYSAYSENQEKEAATLLGTALYEKDPDKRIDVLKKVINEHGSTDASKIALPILARAYLDRGDKENALKYFEESEKKTSKNTIIYQTSVLGQGYILEDKGELEKALQKFDEAVKSAQGIERIALLDKARVAKEVGKKDLALEALNTFLSENPSSQDLEFVKFEILELKRTAHSDETPKNSKSS
ncbi:hypothetical protein DBT_2049 [Dissulfuribacter thermophilus]|uniref:Ancillary SecYEG translocon subunit/Cell division coordinator CpoB TPR domain-containing protein n=1 Tax=Dissulfuribacter thermophilus TaxID=1156395 RepID=A0A1B9F3J3_9BACT|nr:tetratricopeptide repeat protein [Dissulfuribacter thermophilus]OCC14507.1 hypothetical protein DBT_2049 [Dissulfuribacter thermophilus]